MESKKSLIIVAGAGVAAWILLRSRSASAAGLPSKNPLASALKSVFPSSPSSANLATGYGTSIAPKPPTTASVPAGAVSTGSALASIAGNGLGSFLKGLLTTTPAAKAAAPASKTAAPASSATPMSAPSKILTALGFADPGGVGYQLPDGLLAWSASKADIQTDTAGAAAASNSLAWLDPFSALPMATWADAEPIASDVPATIGIPSLDGFGFTDAGVDGQPFVADDSSTMGYDVAPASPTDYVPGSDGDPYLNEDVAPPVLDATPLPSVFDYEPAPAEVSADDSSF